MAVYRHQIGAIEAVEHSTFYKDVVQGLSSTPKFLQSKYFYDERGDDLFQQIMQLPEYYLTRSELEIFSMQTKALADVVSRQFKEFDILELGAGDASKSTFLLRYLFQSGFDFSYFPIDISQNIIQLLEEEMPKRIQGLKVQGLNGDYFDMIRKSYQVSGRRKVVLFLGSTVGNYTPENAERFLLMLNNQLKTDDLVFIGFDLKKNPKKILAAYNDRLQVTKAFNLNLLLRINRELSGNFDITCFDHFPTYDPITGACKSYLISLENQEVQIDTERFLFHRNEPIWTELSQKYTEQEINEMAVHTGFVPIQNFLDCTQGFLNAVWRKR
ncbi:MAG TPA: L-histidine N(alpha)-methyltransferase [Flavisolibacter sp.]|nr:L-histidine N(alpha)-methyltransferase [Flavisolibacter sp.]